MSFYNVIITLLTNIGFFNIIVPFLLVYSIMYGLLGKYQIIGNPYEETASGKAARSLISMISAAVGFLVIGATNFILSLSTLIPYMVLFILTLFFLLLSVAPFLQSKEGIQIQGRTRTIFISVAVVIFFIVVVSSLGLFSYIIQASKFISSSASSQSIMQIVYVIVTLGILFGIVYWATKPAKQESQSGQK